MLCCERLKCLHRFANINGILFKDVLHSLSLFFINIYLVHIMPYLQHDFINPLSVLVLIAHNFPPTFSNGYYKLPALLPH